MPTTISNRDREQRRIRDERTRAYAKRSRKKKIPVPTEHMLNREVSNTWAGELPLSELQHALIRFHSLNQYDRDAVLARTCIELIQMSETINELTDDYELAPTQ